MKNNCNATRKRGLYESTNYFSGYMNLWSFKKIKQFIPGGCKVKLLKEPDNWGRLKTCVDIFVKKRKEKLIASRILVFDYSMCAFTPWILQ